METDDPFSEHLINIMLVACGLEWEVNRAIPIERGADTVYRLEARDGGGEERRAVLKAPRETSTERFKHEPKLLQYVSRVTSIPVPTVHAMHLEPIDLPVPYYIMEDIEEPMTDRTSATAFSGEGGDWKARLEQVATDAGRHLALLHNCGPLSDLGPVGIEDGELQVRTSDTNSWSAWLRSIVESNRVPLDELGDIRTEVQQFVRDAVADISGIEPVPIHYDYRPQNLVVDPRDGVTAVLDWGAVRSAHGVYDVVLTEQYLSTWSPLDSATRAIVRENLYDAYTQHRSVDRDTIRQYRELYLAVTRLGALARLSDLPKREQPQQLAQHKAFFRALL